MKLTTQFHLVPRSQNEWSYTSTPQYALMMWCSAQGHLYLLPLRFMLNKVCNSQSPVFSRARVISIPLGWKIMLVKAKPKAGGACFASLEPRDRGFEFR